MQITMTCLRFVLIILVRCGTRHGRTCLWCSRAADDCCADGVNDIMGVPQWRRLVPRHGTGDRWRVAAPDVSPHRVAHVLAHRPVLAAAAYWCPGACPCLKVHSSVCRLCVTVVGCWLGGGASGAGPIRTKPPELPVQGLWVRVRGDHHDVHLRKHRDRAVLRQRHPSFLQRELEQVHRRLQVWRGRSVLLPCHARGIVTSETCRSHGGCCSSRTWLSCSLRWT